MSSNDPKTQIDYDKAPRVLDANAGLALLRRYREEGDEHARDQLVERMIPWVKRIAARFGQRGVESDDLVQVGSVGLLKAIERFDLDRGVPLTTFAEPTVAGEIKRHFRDHAWTVRPPRDLQELNAEVMRAIDFLTSDKKRSPTVRDVAHYLSIDDEAVLEAMHAGGGYRSVSLDFPKDDESAGLDPGLLAMTDTALDRTELRYSLGESFAWLSPRERQVLHMRFFEGLTQSEIAERIGVSQMQISRIIRSALHRMRHHLEGQGVE